MVIMVKMMNARFHQSINELEKYDILEVYHINDGYEDDDDGYDANEDDDDEEDLHLPGTVGWLDGQPPLLVRTNIVMIGFSLAQIWS